MLEGLRLQRGSQQCVLAPRGAAKSTWSSFAFPLWCACYGYEPYIILTSDSGPQACKYLDAIRAEFETNEALQRAFPALAGKGSIWREDRIRLANGVMIEALGTGTKIRGRKNRQYRPTLLIVDDPQNKDHIVSALQRDRSWEWLTKDVMNAGSPTTNIVVLGTALHRECIVCRLQRTAGWQTTVFRSIIEWPKRMDLWQQWERLLCDYDDPLREQHAREFYEQRKALMEE